MRKNRTLDGLLEITYEHTLILDNRDSDSAFFFLCMTLINGVLCLPMPFINGLAGCLLVWVWERDNDTLYIIRVRVMPHNHNTSTIQIFMSSPFLQEG